MAINTENLRVMTEQENRKVVDRTTLQEVQPLPEGGYPPNSIIIVRLAANRRIELQDGRFIESGSKGCWVECVEQPINPLPSTLTPLADFVTSGPTKLWISPNAYVLGRSTIKDNVNILDYVVIDTCKVQDNVLIKNNVKCTNVKLIKDNAKIQDTATLTDVFLVEGNALIKDTAQVSGNVKIGGNVVIGGSFKLNIGGDLGDPESNPNTADMDLEFGKYEQDIEMTKPYQMAFSITPFMDIVYGFKKGDDFVFTFGEETMTIGELTEKVISLSNQSKSGRGMKEKDELRYYLTIMKLAEGFLVPFLKTEGFKPGSFAGVEAVALVKI